MDHYEASFQTYSSHEQVAPPMPMYVEEHAMQNYAMAQQHASMLAMSNAAPRTTETKPRLAKEDVAFLERAFDNNHKPSTQTKRGYAENMGVDLPRINNWFQNRRAKQKNLRRQEEFRSSQCQEFGFTRSEPSSPDEFDDDTFFDEDIEPLQHSATFPQMAGPPPAVASYNPQYANPASASMESLNRTIAAAQLAQHPAPQEFNNTFFEHDHVPSSYPGTVHSFANVDRSQFSHQDESTAGFNTNQNYSFSSPSNNIYHAPQTFQDGHQLSQQVYDTTPKPYAPTFPTETMSNVPQIVTTFPSQLIVPQSHDEHVQTGSQAMGSTPEATRDSSSTPVLKYEIQESEESSATLPPSTLSRAPPSAGIASRRPKVHNKPAALGLNISRGRPQMGPRTVSHATESFRRQSDSPMGSPMRRIVSAGGNRCGMPGRIQKPGVESAQRSPINFGSFTDASAFMDRNSHNIRKPLSLAPASLAPPTPLSPTERYLNSLPKDESSSQGSPIDGSHYMYSDGAYTTTSIDQNGAQNPGGDQSLTSPPVTPENGLGVTVPSHCEWNTSTFQENDWFDVSDAPIYTPAQDSFNLEIQMPQPAYIHSLSQPVTPAMFQYPPNVFLTHESSPLEGESDVYSQAYGAQQEYNFPETHTQFYISPVTKQKTFQFSNSTPADFSEK